jgi:3-hydroxybutyryl-CoA dehydrogenase
MKNASAESLSVGFINMTNVSFENFVLNFGFGSKEEKKAVLREHASKNLYMDLTCFDPAEFYAEFPQLKGSFAALFCDETKKIEVHFKEKSDAVSAKLKEFGFHLVETTIISCGFVFPRTIVQIINEAHFALEEEVASKEDINRAMKFGVNYPKGPFEWCDGKEEVVKTLLNELLSKTNDKRYICSKLL